MIQITAAILEQELPSVDLALNKFLEFGNIDLDVCSKDLTGNDTPSVRYLLRSDTLYSYFEIGFHLMVNDAQNQIGVLLDSTLTNKKVRITVHQEEAFLGDLGSKLPPNWELGVYLLKDEELKSPDFYRQFDEVQFMAIEIGFQGGEFVPSVLTKVDRLRSLGYNGKVSLDGGVNIETAQLIKSHRIDRVSVGSYFKESKDPEGSFNRLYQALND